MALYKITSPGRVSCIIERQGERYHWKKANIQLKNVNSLLVYSMYMQSYGKQVPLRRLWIYLKVWGLLKQALNGNEELIYMCVCCNANNMVLPCLSLLFSRQGVTEKNITSFEVDLSGHVDRESCSFWRIQNRLSPLSWP